MAGAVPQGGLIARPGRDAFPARFPVGPAAARDDADLRRLLRESPMPGWVRLSLEREPNYFLAGTIEGDSVQTFVARNPADGRVIGMGTRSERDAFLNGRVRRMGYFGQLRLAPAWRGSRRRLQEAYRAWRPIQEAGGADFCLTSIVEDNVRARRLLTLGVPGLPTYREFARFSTLALPCLKRGPRRRVRGVRRGTSADLGAIAEFLQRQYARYQCAPVWTEAALLSSRTCRGLSPGDFFLSGRNGEIEGCLALWNQQGFKQSVVRGYGETLGRWRLAINRLGALAGTPLLPPPGAVLGQAYLSHVAVAAERQETLGRLIRRAKTEAVERGIDWLLIGFAAGNPLLGWVRRRFLHIEYRSVLYLVYWPDGEDAAAALDPRKVHVELATL